MVKRVGIMGGTFNPIHLGHLMIAEHAYEALRLDKVLFIPSGNSYMKDNRLILDSGIRFSMVQEAIADNPHFEISSIEVRKTGNSYSCETIADLKREQPDTEFFFLVGADSLFMMEEWFQPHRIFQEVTVAVAVRDGQDIEVLQGKISQLEKKYKCCIILMTCRNIDISSTEIRDLRKAGKSIRYLVHPLTEQTIIKQRYYES